MDPKVCMLFENDMMTTQVETTVQLLQLDFYLYFDWILEVIVVILECQAHREEKDPLDREDQKGMHTKRLLLFINLWSICYTFSVLFKCMLLLLLNPSLLLLLSSECQAVQVSLVFIYLSKSPSPPPFASWYIICLECFAFINFTSIAIFYDIIIYRHESEYYYEFGIEHERWENVF